MKNNLEFLFYGMGMGMALMGVTILYHEYNRPDYHSAMIQADIQYQAAINARPKIETERCMKVALACDYQMTMFNQPGE